MLRLLAGGERYGYELVELLDRRTGGVLAMGQSTLYPLLYNLEAKGLLASRVATADNGRPRRYYRLTDKGKRRLAKDSHPVAGPVDRHGPARRRRGVTRAALSHGRPARVPHHSTGETPRATHWGPTMSDSLPRTRWQTINATPFRDLLRGRITARLDWPARLAAAGLPARRVHTDRPRRPRHPPMAAGSGRPWPTS